MPTPLARLLACGLCLTFAACHPHMEPYQTERFTLSAAPAAAEGYPMETIEGRFTTSDGQSFPIAAPQFLEGDWGLSHVSWGVGNPLQPAPDSLELRWFSYPEDKFYQGRFALPQQRIYDLLKQGYWSNDNKKQRTYNELTVCILPAGALVVWLSGDQMQVLIGRYQAREINYDFRRFNEAANRSLMIQQERAKLPAQVQEQIRTGTLSAQQWDNYLKTYNWRLETVMQESKKWQLLPLYDYYARYFNGEKYTYPTTMNGKKSYLSMLMEHSIKSVPKILGLFVQNKYNEKHEVRIASFDETETLAAFQTLAARHPQEPIVLRVEVNKLFIKATLTLSNGFQTLPLDKATVKIFEER